MRDNWFNSFSGKTAVNSLFYKERFKSYFKNIPTQKIGLYLYENQSWEYSLLFYWKKYGHGKIFAVQHSTIRYWDLRYTINNKYYLNNVFPEGILTNGKHAYSLFLENGFKDCSLYNVEALRYEYLSIPNSQVKSNYGYNKKKVLIIGDYLESETKKLLEIVLDSYSQSKKNMSLYIKFHPNCVFDVKRYREFNIIVEDQSFTSFKTSYDYAIATNMTSAAVDSYLLGIRTFIMQSRNNLNFSSLRDFKEVIFFSNSHELAEKLFNVTEKKMFKSNKSDFFNFNKLYTGWDKIINFT